MVSDSNSPDAGTDALERRLATILAADVVGYSKMMGENEEATVQALRRHRAIFDALLAQHHGRVFNTAGDMILAEFPSAVEAVRCAKEIQSAIQTRNDQVEPGKRMLFRMGINLGDVVVQGGDLLGDGVNVAARMQAIAESGGICISGSVYDQIVDKLSMQFKSMGEQHFKNIARSVRTFSVTDEDVQAVPPPPTTSDRRRTGPGAVAIALAAIAAIAGAGYWFYRGPDSHPMQTSAPATVAKTDVTSAAPAQSPVVPPAAPAATPPANSAPVAAPVAPKAASSAVSTPGPAASTKRAAPAVTAASAPPAAAAAPSRTNSADGNYRGQVCNSPQDTIRRTCWKVPIQVRNGEADATWTLRLSGRQVRMHASISANGIVRGTLDGWKLGSDTPMSGAMDGTAADGRIEAAGRWANGTHFEGHWELAR